MDGSYQVITLPDNITEISNGVFDGCSNLPSITIPNSVTIIDDWAFNGCSSLTDVYFTGTLWDWARITIGDANDALSSAMIHCRQPNVFALPTALTTIESEAFTSLSNVDAIRIPAAVTTIATDAFDRGMTLLVPAGSQWVQWAESNGYVPVEE